MADLPTTAGGAPRMPQMPPTLAGDEQNAAAGEIGNNQRKDQFQPYQTENDETSPGNLMKGDIGGEQRTAAPSEEATENAVPPEMPPEEQAAAARQVQLAQSIKNKISRVRKDIMKSAQSLKGDLLKGRLISLLKHIPGIGALINSFESMIKKNIDRAIVILEFIKKRLENLKTLLAEADGLKLWGKIFAETFYTIIIPLILLLILPVWLLLVAMMPNLFSRNSRIIENFIKLNINPVLEKLKALSQKTKNEKAAALKTRELEASVEAQTATPPPQPA